MAHAYQRYIPPESMTTDAELVYAAYPDAGLRRRFANMVLDSIIYQVPAAPVFVAIEMLAPGVSASLLNSYAISFGCLFAYYVGFETILGRTPGKMITGTRVIGDSGETPSLASVLGRSVIRMIPFEPFSFLGGMNPRGWHDEWTSTRVVYTRQGPERSA